MDASDQILLGSISSRGPSRILRSVARTAGLAPDFLSNLSGAAATLPNDGPPGGGGRPHGDTMHQPSYPTEPTPDTNDSREGGYLASPMPVTATAAALPAWSRQARFARIGLLGIAAAGLVAAALLIFSSTTSPTGTLAAGTTGGSSDTTMNGPVDLLNGLGPGGRGGDHFGFGGITITAISGNSLSLKTAVGWTRTIAVDTGTTYTRSGATISLGDLKVGDQIGFRQTRETNGTFTIDSIVVILPSAGGEVTKIDGSTITVTQRDGTTATITVDGKTTYAVN